MSFQDENDERRPTALVYRCRRCDGLVEEVHPDVEVALRRAIESGMALSVHACSDGAEGVAELIGTGPGRPPRSRAA
jgi:hypothetical protein